MALTQDQILSHREFDVERKHVVIEVRENQRGRFLKVTEEVHGRRNTVIIPSVGIADFVEGVSRAVAEAEEKGT